MISDGAVPQVLAAIQGRLDQVGRAGSGPVLEASADPEETLRRLMVRYLPRASEKGTDPEWRRQVCQLLLSLASAALGDDVRYLDAFNVFYERIAAEPAWSKDRSWQMVLDLYSYLLSRFTERLKNRRRKEEAASLPSIAASGYIPSPAPRDVCKGRCDSERPTTLTVLVLADNAATALRIFGAVSQIGGLKTHILICNNVRVPAKIFYLHHIALAALSRGPYILTLLRALGLGRVHLRHVPLHSQDVVAWLKRKQFWVGLHGMGVIYRESVISAFSRGILNAHIGLLPDYRGRSVLEWSLLAGSQTGVTVFCLDEGIDTGAEVVLRRCVDVSTQGEVSRAKAHLFSLDGEMYRDALRNLLDPNFVPMKNDGSGKRYYVMSKLLTSVVNDRLMN